MSSTFEVTVRKIDKIWPHPSADRLELASVGGMSFQFCVQKGAYKVGDTVVYFPVDSILPEDVIDNIGLWAKDENGQVIRDKDGRPKTMLAGTQSNRIRTVELRGEISQGMVCPIRVALPDSEKDVCFKGRTLPAQVYEEGDDVKEILGVTKYDAPESVLEGYELRPLPDGLSSFDVEGADSHPYIVDLLMDQKVCVTEKLEGTNHSFVRTTDDRIAVCARNNEVLEIPGGDPYSGLEAFRNSPWDKILNSIPRPDFPLVPVSIRGELIGNGVPQSFYPFQKPVFRCFGIKVGQDYLNVSDLCALVPEDMRVPILAYDVTLREWLAGRTIQEASNGKSVLAPNRMREGIVVIPMVEQKVQWKNGATRRLIIKQRSPAYLAKEKS